MVCRNVCCVAGVVKVSVFSLGVMNYIVCVCRASDGCWSRGRIMA